MPRPSLRLVLAAQCAYYAVGGVWPLVHYASFEAVTGKKKDAWLVKTVASMILAVMATHVRALREHRTAEAARVAGVGAGIALGWAATWYPLRGRISRVYWLDAAAEMTFVAALLAARGYGVEQDSPPEGERQHDRGTHLPPHP